MKTKNNSNNALSAVLASFLSILLVLCLLGTCAMSLANSFTRPSTMSDLAFDMFDDFDLEEYVIGRRAGAISSHQATVELEIVEELLESDTAEDLMEMYAEDVAYIIENPYASSRLTPSAIAYIVRRDADDLTEIVCDVDPMADPIAIRSFFMNQSEEAAYDFLREMAPDRLLRLDMRDTLNQVSSAASVIFFILLIITLAIAGCIFVCRIHGFGGFLWLGIDAIVAAVPLWVIALVLDNLGSYNLAQLCARVLGTHPHPNFLPFVRSAMSAFSDLVFSYGTILFVLGILMIAAFFLLKRLAARKAAAADKVATPAATDTVVAPVAAEPVAEEQVPAEPIAPAPAEEIPSDPQ